MAPHHITVNVVAPGPIDTSLTAQHPDTVRQTVTQAIPLGMFGQPQDIAAAAAFLATEEARFITGEVSDVNGGLLMD